MNADERKALVKQLKRGRNGWTTLLPREAATVLGQRIAVRVNTTFPPRGGEPPLTAAEVDLLEAIFADLPRLAARAERAFVDYGGYGAFDEQDRLGRPHIWVDREKQAGRSAGRWTMVIDVRGTDYGWHIEFARTRFKEIWAGD